MTSIDTGARPNAPMDGMIGDLTALAREMAATARTIVLRHYATLPDFDDKADSSPVTAADREVEAALRTLIAAKFPEHGIYGEEFGAERTDADFVWVLDPIDGTKSFISGRPLFGTLIGLLKDGLPYLGVLDMPILAETWVGVQGQGTTCNGQAVKTRACADLARAWMHCTSPAMHQGLNFDRFDQLRRRCHHTLYGGDCYAYAVVAKGRADLVCENSMEPYDYAALVPIIEAAGGRMTDWTGKPLGLHNDGSVLGAGDPAVHALALAVLAR